MSETNTMTKDELGAAIARKAFKDDSFRKRILSNANEVFEQESGQKLPAGVTVKVYEDTESTINFAIPAKPANANELSDSDLEAVAGGTSPAVVATVGLASAIIPIVSQISQQQTKKHHW